MHAGAYKLELEIGLKYCTKITSKIHCIRRFLRPHPQLPRRPEAGTSRTRRGGGRLSPGWQEGGASTPSATVCVSPGSTGRNSDTSTGGSPAAQGLGEEACSLRNSTRCGRLQAAACWSGTGAGGLGTRRGGMG